MARLLVLSLSLFFGSSLLACGGDDDGPPAGDAGLDDGGGDGAVLDPLREPPPGCNPVGSPVDCLFPYPSDVFVVDDDGPRVRVAQGALPTARLSGVDVPADLLREQPARGFSPVPAIAAAFAQPIDDEPLVFHTEDVSVSTTSASPTLLLDAESGEAIPHFAELDPLARSDEQRALLIRPMVRLEGGRRYVVAIRGLSRPDGTPVVPPAAFAAMRDGAAPAWMAATAARYETDVFPVLASFGAARTELELAWDFTVRPDADAMADLLRVRELLLAAIDVEPPVVTVTNVVDAPRDGLSRRIEATMRVPLFLESTEPGGLLTRDADGAVRANGEVDVPFSVLVPESVDAAAPGAAPARALQYGHGFFGSREEAEGDFQVGLANDHGFVVFALDWWGMSEADREAIATALVTDPSTGLQFTDRLHQAMANQVALARAIRTTLAELPELLRGGEPIFDPSAVYFYGLSLGHILGGTYLAIAPDVERGVLGAGGANFGLILFRALPFGAFRGVLSSLGVDDLEMQKFGVLVSTSFDRVDPGVYAPWVTDPGRGGVFPGAPAERRVLVHLGIGDPAVPNLAGRFHARALGAALLEPPVRPVFGLETASAPYDGSAVVEFDMGLPDPLPGTYADLSWSDNEVHDGVRRLPASIAQADAFLRPGGLVEATCDGPCDPE